MSTDLTRTDHGIEPKQLYRWSGGALVAALPLQLAGFLLHPPSEQVEHITSSMYGPAHVVLFASWVLIMVGLPGLYARQANRAGRLGLAGFVITMVAIAYHLYLTLYEGFAVPVMADDPATRALLGPDQPLAHGAGALGPVAFLLMVGFPVLGLATLRARVLPRATGWLQIAALPASILAAIGAGIAFDGATGSSGDNWISGIAPISLLYWVLCAGYAIGGRSLQTLDNPEPVRPTPATTASPALG